MAPEQNHDAEPTSTSRELPEISPSDFSPASGLPDDDRSSPADSDRRGWRAYFPAAARKESKAEAVEEDSTAAVIKRLATTLSTLIWALFLFVVSVSANTYIVTMTADNANNSSRHPAVASRKRESAVDSCRRGPACCVQKKGKQRSLCANAVLGYLRRNPNAAPDSDLSGYDFWLNKLNQFGGSYVDAAMIKAFITSIEYRQRFAQ